MTTAVSTLELYLTEREFAERYHLGRRTVQRWRQSGEGPAWCRLGQRRIVYRLSDIEAWALGRTYRHRADELSRQAVA
jgi:predicted DNA-binding transcriptional regulator AlpA